MPGRAQPRPADSIPALVPRETQERLEAFTALVGKWTTTINLVGRGERDAIWGRHVLDSLRLAPLIPPNTDRAIDLGSGAGFPGLVLAIVTGIPFDLIEADQRKAAFLHEAQRITGAPAIVHCARIEAVSLPPAPLVTARALAPLTVLLAHTVGLLRPDGVALFPKGVRADAEVTDARAQWSMQLTRHDDPVHPGSTILAITGLTRA